MSFRISDVGPRWEVCPRLYSPTGCRLCARCSKPDGRNNTISLLPYELKVEYRYVWNATRADQLNYSGAHSWNLSYFPPKQVYLNVVKVKVKVKQFHYRPGQAQRVLRKLRFPDFMTTAQDGGRLSALRTGRLYSQEILLVIISVTG